MLCRAVFCLPSPHPLPRYRATHEPPEQPGGEGWLVSAEQQKVVQFKPDASTAHAQVGGGAHLQLDSAQSAGAPDPATDAAAQRHRSLEHDAQNRLATLSTAGALMNLSDDCWTATTSFANVVEVCDQPMTNGSGTWANNQPPAAAEKLWRGLALVGAFHIGGMLINVIFQMMGNNSLDGIPAKFLGL